jgi:hypothetical protein
MKYIRQIIVTLSIFAFVSCSNEKEYITNTRSTLETVNKAAEFAGTVTSHYSKVWDEAIQNKLYKGEYIGSDFNIALQKTSQDLKEVGTITLLDNLQIALEISIKKLREHPSKYETIYNQTIECYGYTTELLSLAQTPKGSLLSYNSRCNELRAKIHAKINEIRVKLPE